jgi:hypothetical protein
MPGPHWQVPAPTPEPRDEVLWHATTYENVVRIRDSDAIKPEYGTGANGVGFYLCPRLSDYQKAMALRVLNSKEVGNATSRKLFLLKILVKGFYTMEPYVGDGLVGNSAQYESFDFVASRWNADVIGDCKK